MCIPTMNISSEPLEKYYDVLHELGRGQFASVRHCVHKVTGVEYASKFIRKRRFNNSRRGVKRSEIEREITVLRDVGGHQNVISLYEVYETPTEVILVLELVSGGELFDYVCSRQEQGLHEEEASDFIRQILLGVQHLHGKYVVHLDLKPENVMLLRRGNTQVKLIDFGLSRKIIPGVEVKDMIGTPEFVAPEIVSYEPLTSATDMWAIGVVTYILLSGMSPFLGETRDMTFCNITACKYEFFDESFRLTSQLAKDFIRRLLVKDPRERMCVEACLKHPWIQPSQIDQVIMRRQSEINVHLIKAFNVRRKWRQCVNVVILCNRLVRNARLRLETAKKQNHLDASSDSFNSLYIPDDVVLSAVLCASEEGNLTGLEQLAASAHINVNKANELGETAMHVAAGAGQLEVVRFLQLKGARLDLTDKHGDNALYWASRHGHLSVVQMLCEEGINIDNQNKCKETTLHIAVRYGQMSVVQYLCQRGANVNIQDEHGETPLHIACWHGLPMLLDILCRCDALLNLQNRDEESALHCAAARGHMECVQTLLDAGAGLDSLDKLGQTALHMALRRHHVEIALLLMTRGCNLDIQDANMETPLHVACHEGLLSAVQTLCHLGCQVDILNNSSLSPLHIAAKEGQMEIVRTLCLAGCDINVKNRDGLTPEITALAGGHKFIGDLLAILKSDHEKDVYIDQLCPGATHLKRVKLKVFGHSGVGKTRLLHALQTGMLGSFLSGIKRWSENGSTSSKDEIPIDHDIPPPLAKYHKNALDNVPSHPGYTRGIGVTNISVSGVGEFSAWEFSGYEPYHNIYDHFVGNADCQHIILFRATDPTEVQYAQVLYWINFLKGRVVPQEPIGHCGKLSKPVRVVLAATHADLVSPPLPTNPEGEWTCSEGDALLKTFKHRFSADFDIHDRLILLDCHQSNCLGIKMLRNYLASTRNEILQTLPKTTGFLENTVVYLQSLRKQVTHFPVMTWPSFVQRVRVDVNPLAGEIHCRQLIQQLQLIGEVIYLKGDAQDLDYVVLSPEWLCSQVIGFLLSSEFLTVCKPTGIYSADDFALLFPDISQPLDLLQILDALQLCTQCDTDGDLEYEFPPFIFLTAPEEIWESQSEGNLVYGGMRMHAPHGMQHSLLSVFCRLQTQLRRSMQEFQDPVDADLCQWKECSKMCSGQMEGLIRMWKFHDRQDAIEVLVRGPPELAASCFYFLEDLAQLTEQTISEIAPGLNLERHFLSPIDLACHSDTPAVYSPEAVMQMQQRESVRVKNNREGEEPFTDVVCFGAREVAVVLTLGIDLPVAQLQLSARRELAALLDPCDSMGRDWSILAVRLGLEDQLPDVDSSESALSRTDQLLAEWALLQPRKATLGVLCNVLGELGRQDAVESLYRTVPLYLFASTEDPPTSSEGHDSGMVSAAQSHSTSATSQRSNSTLSR